MRFKKAAAVVCLFLVFVLLCAYTYLKSGGVILNRYSYYGLVATKFPEYAAKSACKEHMLISANDPDSIEWIDSDSWPIQIQHHAGSESEFFVVQMRIRGKNAFGAKILRDVECQAEISTSHVFVSSFNYD